MTPILRADTILWTGAGSADTNWSNGSNWTNLTAGTAGTAPDAADDVVFFDPGSAGTAGTPNNLVDAGFAGTIGSLQYGNTNGFHTTVIAPGQTLNITGAGGLRVFTPGNVTSGAIVWATITGAGATLHLNNTGASILANQGSSSGSTPRAILDLSGLDALSANINRIGIGTTSLPNSGGSNQRTTGTIYLAKTNVLSLAYTDTLADYLTGGKNNALEIARNPGNSAGLSYLYLGVSNAFYVDSIGVGRDKSTAGRYAGFMGFNPAFLGLSPVARFRGVGGDSSRVTWWGIGDMNGSSSSAQSACGTNDFSGGYVDALVDTLSLGRDCSPSHTTSGINLGVLTFTAGRIEANTILLGNQSLGPSSSSTANEGILNVSGAGATLIADSDLILGNTVQNSVAAQKTFGVLNVTGGTVLASNIAVGPYTTAAGNSINLNNATLIITNSLATNSAGLAGLTLADSTVGLTVPADASLAARVQNLVTGGTTNHLQLTVPVFGAYPVQISLIQYSSLSGSGFNLGLAPAPASAPNAYLIDNSANHSIDIVLPTDPRPTITVQPPSYAGSPGDSPTLSATATGVHPLSYQWYKGTTALSDGPTGNGSTLSGSATNSLTIGTAQEADSGNYTVVITNAYGAATSSVAVVTISTSDIAPSISGPYDQTAIVTSNVVITANAIGKPLPSLQWRFNGGDLSDGLQADGSTISGSTTATLSIGNVQYPTGQGTYSLVAVNSAGAATNSMFLTVIVPPAIAVQPASLIVTNTQSASFSVVSTNGVPAPEFQWLKDGYPISPSANSTATNATLVFAAVSPPDMGTYSVRVSNPAGFATSSGATLTVNSAGLLVVSTGPTNDATGIGYDTPLYVTFAEPPVLNDLGTIRIYNAADPLTPVDTLDMSLNENLNPTYAAHVQPRNIGGDVFNSFPVMINGTTAAIYPHAGVMTSNQTYFVTIDDGVFKDSAGAYFAGISDPGTWRFTTKVAGPANPTNLVVAADGSGDFMTVQGAVDSVPANNTTPTIINIRNGTYTEIVDVKSKNNLIFRGESRNGARIGYPNNNNVNAGAPWRSMFVLNGNDCSFENLTITNTTPKGGSQAEAIDVEGTRATFYNMELDSYQDTFLVHSAGRLVYFQDCLIQGDTDFNWGYGTVFWTNCELRVLSSGGHVTQPRSPEGQNGFSFVNCRVTRANSSVTSADLGRSINTPTTPAEVIFANCLMDNFIMGYASDAGTNFWSYANSNLTATASKTLAHATVLPASSPIVTNALNATLWLYGWVPQLLPNIISQPTNVTVTAGQTATLTVQATGLPNPTYQWLQNGTNAPYSGAESATLIIPDAQAADAATYSVIVANVAGSVTSETVTLTVLTPVAPTIGQVTRMPDGNVQFPITGVAGLSYRVWASSNLSLTPIAEKWTLLDSSVFGSNPAIFTDLDAPNYSQRFYIVTVP